MNFRKLTIATGIVSCFALPAVTHAAGASLNGWGSAFAAAHANSGAAQIQGSGELTSNISAVLARTPQQQPEMSNDSPSSEMPAMEAPTSEDTAMEAPATEDMAENISDSEAPESEESSTEEMQEVATQGNDDAQAESEGASASVTAALEASIQLGGSNSDAAAQALDGAYAAVNEVVDGVAGQVTDGMTEASNQMGGTQTLNYSGSTAQSVDAAGLATVNAGATGSLNAAVMGASQMTAITSAATSAMQAALAARPATLTGLLR